MLIVGWKFEMAALVCAAHEELLSFFLPKSIIGMEAGFRVKPGIACSHQPDHPACFGRRVKCVAHETWEIVCADGQQVRQSSRARGPSSPIADST
jgi:hypothetical protein